MKSEYMPESKYTKTYKCDLCVRNKITHFNENDERIYSLFYNPVHPDKCDQTDDDGCPWQEEVV